MPATVTLSGTVVVDQATANAVVCADLNANGACDAAEPTSARTGTDGRFSIVSQPANAAADTALRAAPLLAQIAGGSLASGASVDAAQPDAALANSAFVLRAPGGKADTQINPLTTLVQAGVTSGLSLAAAEAAVARQLAVAASAIYDYQGDPVSAGRLAANTRSVAVAVAGLLARGATVLLSSADADIAASDQLTALSYTDAANYSYRLSRTAAQKTVDGSYVANDVNVGRTAGAVTAAEVLASRAALTPTGWTLCDTALTLTNGLPSRNSSCGGTNLGVGGSVGNEDIGGQRIGDVLTRLRTAEGANTMLLLDPAVFGTATFPAGASLRSRVTFTLLQTPFINNTAPTEAINARGVPLATLEGLVAALPTASVNGTAGLAGLGLLDDTHSLRVAFTDATTAQFYRCDYVALPVATNSNCLPFSTSGYAVTTTNGVRLLSFASFPATNFGQTRGFTEYAGRVYAYRTPRPERASNISSSSRLSPSAWNAIKDVLQLP